MAWGAPVTGAEARRVRVAVACLLLGCAIVGCGSRGMPNGEADFAKGYSSIDEVGADATAVVLARLTPQRARTARTSTSQGGSHLNEPGVVVAPVVGHLDGPGRG